MPGQILFLLLAKPADMLNQDSVDFSEPFRLLIQRKNHHIRETNGFLTREKKKNKDTECTKNRQSDAENSHFNASILNFVVPISYRELKMIGRRVYGRQRRDRRPRHCATSP